MQNNFMAGGGVRRQCDAPGNTTRGAIACLCYADNESFIRDLKIYDIQCLTRRIRRICNHLSTLYIYDLAKRGFCLFVNRRPIVLLLLAFYC